MFVKIRLEGFEFNIYRLFAQSECDKGFTDGFGNLDNAHCGNVARAEGLGGKITSTFSSMHLREIPNYYSNALNGPCIIHCALRQMAFSTRCATETVLLRYVASTRSERNSNIVP